MNEAINIKLPDEFFTALSEIKTTISDNVPDNRYIEQYKNSIVQEEVITKVVSSYTSSSLNDYKNIGKAMFSGGVNIFIDEWKKYQKQEAYKKVNDKKENKNTSIIKNIINIPVTKEKDNSSLANLISNTLLMAAAGLGIYFASQGTALIGQLGEVGFTALKALPIFKKDFIPNLVKSLSIGVNNIIKPLSDIAINLSKFGSFGKVVSNVISFGAKSISGFGTIIGNLIGKLGSTIISRLKFIPYIGGLLGLYQSYLRFNRGDLFGGTIELLAGIANFIPIPGLAIAVSTGLNLFQMLIDGGTSTGGGIFTAGASLISAGASKVANLFPTIGKMFSGLLKGVGGTILKRIPFIGSIISFGFAINDFMSGSAKSGVLNILAGIANLFPGVGTVIALAIDVINMLTDSDEPNKANKTNSNTFFGSIGNFFSKLWDSLCDIVMIPINWIKSYFNWYVDSMSKIFNYIKGIFTFNIKDFGHIFEEPMKLINDIISIPGNIIKNIGNFFSKLWDSLDIKGIFNFNIKNLTKIFEGPMKFINDIISIPGKIIKNIGKFFTNIFASAIDVVSNIFNWFSAKTTIDETNISNENSLLGSFISNVYSKISNLTKNMMGKITSSITNIFNDITNMVTSVINKISSIWDGVKSMVKNIGKLIWKFIKNPFDTIKSMINNPDSLFSETSSIESKVIKPIPTKKEEQTINLEEKARINIKNNSNENKSVVENKPLIEKINNNNNLNDKNFKDLISAVNNVAHILTNKDMSYNDNRNTIINNQSMGREGGFNISKDPRFNYVQTI